MPAELLPLALVAEGFEQDASFNIADNAAGAGYLALIDPIDGIRGLMYDKRSAWFLAAVPPNRGGSTRMSDIIASVVVEIPTSKQTKVDIYWASESKGLAASTKDLLTGESMTAIPRPSQAVSLEGGFAQVSNFFPETKRLASDLMERIVSSSLGAQQAGRASVFEDQYVSSGGQMVELFSGRDRFCCDVRPLFCRALAVIFHQVVHSGRIGETGVTTVQAFRSAANEHP